jgi:molybdate transport system substrate-binding protein
MIKDRRELGIMEQSIRGWKRLVAACVIGGLLPAAIVLEGCNNAKHSTMTLSIAASLQDAIIEVESSYKHDHGAVDFRNNFGSSGTLAGEIEQGAPVDAIISAGPNPIDDLQARGLLEPGTRIDLLRNSLVLIAPQDSKLTAFDDLARADVRTVALGDPASVPAGRYGRQTLSSLKLYDKLRAKIVLAKDVRQVLSYVETGNADAGLVYSTDAKISTKVRVVAVAPESSHDPIVYPLAIVAGSRNQKAARDFMAYLGGLAARAIFLKHGFRMA